MSDAMLQIRLSPTNEGDASRMLRCAQTFSREKPTAKLGPHGGAIYSAEDLSWHCYVYRTKTAIIVRRC